MLSGVAPFGASALSAVAPFGASTQAGLGCSLNVAKRRPGGARDTYPPVTPEESTSPDLAERVRGVHVKVRRSIGSVEGSMMDA